MLWNCDCFAAASENILKLAAWLKTRGKELLCIRTSWTAALGKAARYETELPEGLALHKIYLIVFAENTASATKYSHLGFQFEARIQEHYRLKNTYHDMVQMRIFAEEWRKRK